MALPAALHNIDLDIKVLKAKTMTLTVWIRVMAGIVVLSAFTAIGVSWRVEMRNRAELSAELAATKFALAAADARQRERDAKLADTLAAIAKQKRAVRSPAQIVKDLPLQMHLPVDIALQNVPAAPGALINESVERSVKAGSPITDAEASNLQAIVPGEDLKSMYDFALDCKACQARLAA
ncbi:MAG: hypothetical protein M3P45_09440, partial [Acidobacteriota bacterium]|nr:hypothetical protein [Acidobacteriota bacterium]